jgi:hypothetical protein
MARVNQELQGFTNGTACPATLLDTHVIHGLLKAVVLDILAELLELRNR